MGEKMRRLWQRLSNEHGEVAMAGAAALPPEVQERLARLEKLEKEHSSLGYKFRAHERLIKELGDAVEYDANGNPIALKADPNPAANAGRGAGPVNFNGHPLSALGLEDPSAVDTYYEQLFQKRGYLTRAEAEKLADARAQMYAGTVLGNARVWRNYDKLTTNEKYKALSDMNSDLAKRTARILQERGYGQPVEGARGFDEWRYQELDRLQLAADLARLEVSEESKQAEAAAAAGASAQAGAALTAAPGAAGATAAGGGGKPDFASMGSVDDVLTALDKTASAGPPN